MVRALPTEHEAKVALWRQLRAEAPDLPRLIQAYIDRFPEAKVVTLVVGGVTYRAIQ